MADSPKEMCRHYGIYQCPECKRYAEPDKNGNFICQFCDRVWSVKSDEILHEKLLNLIYKLMDAKPGTPEMNELKRLTYLAELYEDKNYRIGEDTEYLPTSQK